MIKRGGNWIKLGNLLWAEWHNKSFGFHRGFDLRVTLLPRGRDANGEVIAAFDKVFGIGDRGLKMVGPYIDGVRFDPQHDPFNDKRVTANAEDILDAD